MSEIRIGATEPTPDAPAFAVSRDSGGILIAVRDNAAPQFAVSRDAEGLLLSAWPVAPPLPTSYVASAYVLGLGVGHDVGFNLMYWDAGFHQLGVADHTATVSLTEWRRVSSTHPVPETAAYVSVRIRNARWSPQGSYWTAFKVEAGTEPTPYGGGGANLLLNPKFATDLACWSAGREFDPLAVAYSREGSLPSPPEDPPGITTALKYVSDGIFENSFYFATHDEITLPT